MTLKNHRNTRKGGFTLTEVILAVGVVAFTLTSLTGLMVVGLDSNKNSADETRSIYIAQQILSDLRGSEGADSGGNPALRKVITKVALRLDSTRPESRDLLGAHAESVAVNLTSPTLASVFIAHDENGDPVTPIDAALFADGTPAGQFATKVEFLDATVGGAPQAGLKRVKITVGSPARAKDINREHYVYETLVSTL